MGQQETAIYKVLRKAQADGSLNQIQDARALARFFLAVAWGINAVNKRVADSGVFRDVVRVAMTAWMTPGAARTNASEVKKHPGSRAPQRRHRQKVAHGQSVPHNSKYGEFSPT